MDFKEIRELIKLVDKSNISEIRIRRGDFRITLRTKEFTEAIGNTKTRQSMIPMNANIPNIAPQLSSPIASEQTSPAKKETDDEDTSHLIEIKSPMVGTFYRSPSPDKPPFVNVGDVVNPGDKLCIIEAMKLFNEIDAEISGKIVKVLIDDTSPVEYDQELFLIDPNAV